MKGFRPPLPVTGGSPCSWIDHRASGLIRITKRTIHTRFRFGYANSLTLLYKLTRRLIMQKACGRLRSHSLYTHDFRFYFTPLPGFFSPFPHGTGSLSVIVEYLALEGGPPIFRRRFTCDVLLRILRRSKSFSHTGLSPAMAELSRTFC